MPAVVEKRARDYPEPLDSGDRLSTDEFLRRYEARPELKNAQLIEGIVHMPSPVRITQHAVPDGLIHLWLATYAARTLGVEFAPNATAILDAGNAPQPDSLLRILPKFGGRTNVNDKGYLVGAPELVVEVAATSVSIDLHDKLRAYCRTGVKEYLVWRTYEEKFDWFVLDQDKYRPLSSGSDQIIRSVQFGGLWLDLAALHAMDSAKVLDTLQRGLESSEHAAFVAGLRKR
jgi:Uma2 family endonuclease